MGYDCNITVYKQWGEKFSLFGIGTAMNNLLSAGPGF
jgi:hypothetical protein